MSLVSHKKNLKLFIFCISLTLSLSNYAQEQISARMSISYQKVSGNQASLLIKIISKGENGYEPCANLNLNIYKLTKAEEVEDYTQEKIGTIRTDMQGVANFSIPQIYRDSVTNYSVRIENDEKYSDNEEDLTITDASLTARVVEKDSLYHFEATLLKHDGTPLPDQEISLVLKTTFGILSLGEDETYTTDESGFVSVQLPNDLKGIDGIVDLNAILNQNDEFGTIVDIVKAKIGVPVEDESTFNQRTMWSPPSKTPLFLLIVPNIILIAVWFILVLLTFNLFKIYKSK